MQRQYDMLVIGGGPGGYTAALYAARAGLSVAVLEKLSAGGQMALAEQIDNYPGFPNGVDGFTLGQDLQQQAERFGVRTELAQVTGLQLGADPKTVQTSAGIFYGRTVVLALGAGPRLLGLPGEQTLTGKGVHYCAACDGMRYRGKTVAVVGGGNSAVADALSLSRIAGEVLLIHRRDALRAAKVYHRALEEAPNIRILWNTAVTQLLGQEILTGIQIRNLLTGKTEQLDCQGLFVSIGRTPVTDLVRGQLTLDADGYIVAGEDTQTGLPGVYAVGDLRTKQVRQIVTAMADGAVAAHGAETYLAKSYL